MRGALSLILIVPLLAGCGKSIDGEQLRTCRDVIAALNPAGTDIREMRYGPQFEALLKACTAALKRSKKLGKNSISTAEATDFH